LLDLIREQEEISISGGYKLSISRINSLWIENYPVLDFKNELLEMEAELADMGGAESSAEAS
jgi:hypothetical protein